MVLQERLACITLPAMISLIINADDLGWGEERDRGIFLAFTDGIVTSASLLANGRSFAAAALKAKQLNLPVGIHLNLADGRTLAGPIKGLTGPDGELPGKQRLRQCLLTGGCNLEAIRAELAAQIERVLDAGLIPDHLDSHQHCQLFPCLAKMFTELASAYAIAALRSPSPAEPAEDDPAGALGEEMVLYRQLAPEARRAILDAGLKTTDGLWGMPSLNRLDEQQLCRLLEAIPQGNWELMTHPGYRCDQAGPFDGQPREAELAALISPAARAVITRRGIRLGTFGELPCGS